MTAFEQAPELVAAAPVSFDNMVLSIPRLALAEVAQSTTIVPIYLAFNVGLIPPSRFRVAVGASCL